MGQGFGRDGRPRRPHAPRGGLRGVGPGRGRVRAGTFAPWRVSAHWGARTRACARTSRPSAGRLGLTEAGGARPPAAGRQPDLPPGARGAHRRSASEGSTGGGADEALGTACAAVLFIFPLLRVMYSPFQPGGISSFRSRPCTSRFQQSGNEWIVPFQVSMIAPHRLPRLCTRSSKPDTSLSMWNFSTRSPDVRPLRDSRYATC